MYWTVTDRDNLLITTVLDCDRLRQPADHNQYWTVTDNLLTTHVLDRDRPRQPADHNQYWTVTDNLLITTSIGL